jgi:hypothetical protein
MATHESCLRCGHQQDRHYNRLGYCRVENCPCTEYSNSLPEPETLNWKIKFDSDKQEYRGTMIIKADNLKEAIDKFDRISLDALVMLSINPTSDKDA